METPTSAPRAGGADTLQTAIGYHVAGRHAEAEALYRDIVALQPGNAAAHHWLGFLLQQIGRLDEAVGPMAVSLQLDATQPAWFYNYGILAALLQHDAEAAQAFMEAIALQPDNYYSWTNLGALLEKSTEPNGLQQAEQAYRRAIEIDPACADAYYLLSSLCVDLGRFAEAKRFHCLGYTAGPHADKPRIKLSMAYYELGRADAAIALIDEWLLEQPEHPVAQHMAIAYKGLAAPARCTDAYVESTFDGFAESFESTLTKLHYAGPQALAEQLAVLDFAPGSKQVLDLGCGTGLNGPLLRPVASVLEGVDLSRRMLDVAQQKGLYDRLAKAEIGEFLAGLTGSGRYGLMVCFDTLIYFGALETVLALMFANMGAGGWLIFTTETLQETSPGPQDWHLTISGRYSHAPAYVAGLLQASGFEAPQMCDLTIRMESGMPIPGQVVRARKPLRVPSS